MNKSKFLKKSLAMVLAVMLIVAMIPLGASAAEAPALASLTVNGTAIWPDANKTVESNVPSAATTFTLAAALSGTGAAAGTVEAVQKDNVHKDAIAKNDAAPTKLTLSNYSVSGSVYTIPIIVTGNGASETYTLKLTRNDGRSTTKLADKPVVKAANGILDVSVNNTSRLINVNVAYGYADAGVITVTPIEGATVADADVTVVNGAQLNVTSEAGITRAFTVVVNEEPALTSFSIAGKEGVFSDEDDPADGKKETITVTLTEKDIQDKYEEVEANPAREVTFASLAGTTVTGTASGALTNGGKITMTGLGTSVNNPKDFTDTLTVSCNGVTFTYNLKVVVTPKSDCDISYAQIGTEIAAINNNKISAVMVTGYDVKAVPANDIIIRVPVGANLTGDITWDAPTTTATYKEYKNSGSVDLSVAKSIVVTAEDGKTAKKYLISASNSTPDKLSTTLTAFSLMNGTTEYKGSISGDKITVTVPYMTKSLQTWKVYATPDADGKVYEANGAAPAVDTAVVNGTTTVADIAAGSVLDGITNGEDVNIASFVRLLNKKNSSVYHDYSLTVKFEAAKTGKTLSALTVTASDKTNDRDTFRALDSTNTYRASGLANKQIVIDTAYSHAGLSKYVTEFTTAAGGVAFLADGTRLTALDKTNSTDHAGTTVLANNDKIVVLPEIIAKTITDAASVTNNKQYGTEYTVVVKNKAAARDGELSSLSVADTTLRISGTSITGTIPYSATVAASTDINDNSTIFPVFKTSNFAKMGIDASHTFVSESEGAAAATNMKFGFVRNADGTVAVYAWDGASATPIDGTTQKLNVYAENGNLSNSYAFGLKFAAPRTEASITSFRLANTNAVISDRNITVTVPYGTKLNGLIPTFTASAGAKVTVGGNAITSGKTPLDFSRDVEMLVVSEDGSKRNSYNVKVAVSSQFTDVSSSAWYYDYVMSAASAGIVHGYGDGTFKPSNNVTRAEFAIMLVGMLKADTGAYAGVIAFPDCANLYDSAKAAVAYCADKGYISGYTDGSFKPNASITRQEAASVVARALSLTGTPATEFKDAGKISSWAKAAANACKASGIFSGDEKGNFNPTKNITRAETAKVMVDSIGK